jgi:hypothetical protein
VHCLNSLLQGPFFSEIDLMTIAQQLDQREREVMAEAGVDTNEFVKFAAVSVLAFRVSLAYAGARRNQGMLTKEAISASTSSPKLSATSISSAFR